MYLKETTWGDVWPYGYVQDARGETWKIVEEKQGWMLLQNRAGQQVSQMRPADEVPVTALLYTEAEAFDMFFRVFPGAQIIHIEEGSTT